MITHHERINYKYTLIKEILSHGGRIDLYRVIAADTGHLAPKACSRMSG